MPPQHHLSRGVVQHVAGVYLRAQDGGDGPLGAEQEFTARIVQIGRVYDPITVTMIWRARRHLDDAGCHQDGCCGKDAAADPPPAQPGHEMKHNRDGQPGGAHHQATTAGSRGCPVRGIAGLAI
jgi:hypothetical protein